MSRPIKFRAAIKSDHWDDYPKGTWLVSTNWFSLGELWNRVVEFEFKDGGTLPFGDLDPDDEVVFQEFTGLTDKNGKEIYEGDIVNSWASEKYGNQEYIRVVVRLDDRPVIEFKPATGNMLVESNSDDFEVIGNRWENPELLEEK